MKSFVKHGEYEIVGILARERESLKSVLDKVLESTQYLEMSDSEAVVVTDVLKALNNVTEL